MTPTQAYKAALEAAAKVAKNAWLTTPYGSIADADAMNDMCEELAAAIRTIPVPQDAGDMVLVPREPTEAVIEAAQEASEDWFEIDGDNGAWLKDAGYEAVYRAMIKTFMAIRAATE